MTTDAVQPVLNLIVDRCLAAAVAILDPEDSSELLGTGFFISSEHILTCAHVVGDRDRVTIRSGADEAQGEVICAEPASSPEDRPWELPDLALIHVPPMPDHAVAVWLCLDPQYRIEASGTFTGAGYDVTGLTPEPTLGHRIYHSAGYRKPGVIEIAGDTVPKFRSGGPILDRKTGRVVAVMKAARGSNDGVGGYVVPLKTWFRTAFGAVADEILDAHDRYHARHREWPGLCAAFVPPPRADIVGGRPLLEVGLLDLLADARVVLTAPELAEITAPLVSRRQITRDTALRDVALTLANQPTPGPVLLHPAIEFFDDFVRSVVGKLDAAWTRDMIRWLDSCADALGQSSQLRAYRREIETMGEPEGDVYPALRVHVQPSLKSASFDVSVRLHHTNGDVDEELGPGDPVHRNRLWRTLQSLLPEAIGSLPRPRQTLLDLVLPQEFLCEPEPVHRWPMPGGRTIGDELPVVVRVVERWQDEEMATSRLRLQELWETYRGTVLPVAWVTCTGKVVSGDSLGITNPPTSRQMKARGAVTAAIHNGLPLIVWPADVCGVNHGAEPGRGCVGDLFRDRYQAALSGTRLIDLPKKVFELRSQNQERMAEKLVLFWDDADRPYEKPLPLTQPGLPGVN
jgi:NTP-dependent ternary conflict system VMAP-like protein/trypsin-like peptidase